MPIPKTKVFLSSLVTSSTGGYRLLSPVPGDFSQTLLAEAPVTQWTWGINDLNGDGIADIVIGAPGDDDKAAEAGRVCVRLGTATGGTSGSAETAAFLTIDGVAAGDLAGSAVGSVADMNGDGLGEILVGSPGFAADDAGAAFVLWGDSVGGGIDLGDPAQGAGNGKGWIIRGAAAGDAAGTTLRAIADLNGDGKAEVIVGAPGNDDGGTDGGAVYVVWGKANDAAVNLSALGTKGFRIIGSDSNAGLGRVVARVDDRTAAVLVTHLHGLVCDIEPVAALCRRRGPPC